MRNIVKGLRAIGYRLVTANLSQEETAVWASMIASAVSEQQSVNLLPEETAWWLRQIAAENCTHCLFWGESDQCSKH